MNDQNMQQEQKSINIWAIVAAIIITALVVGGGVYAWQKLSLQAKEQSLQQQIADLQNQLTNLEKTTQSTVTTPVEIQEPAEEESQNTAPAKKTFSPASLSSVSVQHDDTWTQREIDIIKTVGDRIYRISFQGNNEEYFAKGGSYARDIELFKEVSVNGKTHYVFTTANGYGHISSCAINPDEACSPRLSNSEYLFVLFHQHIDGAQYPVELDFNRIDDKQMMAEFADIMATLKY